MKVKDAKIELGKLKDLITNWDRLHNHLLRQGESDDIVRMLEDSCALNKPLKQLCLETSVALRKATERLEHLIDEAEIDF